MKRQVERTDTVAGTKLIIRSGNPTPVTFFLAFWLIGWAFGEVFVLASIFARDTPWMVRLFLLVWVSIWTSGGLAVIMGFLQQIGSRQVIEIGRGLLKIEKSYVVLKLERRYDIFNIQNFHVVPTQNKGSKFVFGASDFQFSYKGKKVSFGNITNQEEIRETMEFFRNNPEFKPGNFRA